MTLEPLFPLAFLTGSNNNIRKNISAIKPWVRMAIAEEEQKPAIQLWAKEPSAEFRYEERLRRIRFLRKHGKADPRINPIADQLDRCEGNDRCCCGGCPECGRLLQRWFVRKSKSLIRDEIDKPNRQLVALSIIPSWPIITPGELHTLKIDNLQRRLKYALNKAGIGLAIGGIDFSFNEDLDGRYEPFWSVHFYLITSVANRDHIKRLLKEIFKTAPGIPRPVKIPDFGDSAWRRSYAFKISFKRRIGRTDEKRPDGRKCRNTSRDKLRSDERRELFAYLDQVGFEQRVIFRKVEPSIRGFKVRIKPIPTRRHRIERKSNNRS